MSEKNIEETIESAKEEISSISWRIEDLRNDLKNLLVMLEREERNASEELFGIFIKAGFVDGTKFQVKDNPTVWTITGICAEGYIVESDHDGKHEKVLLRADTKNYVEKCVSDLKIVKSDEVKHD